MQSIYDIQELADRGRVDRILIVAVGRTGSTWLTQALDHTPGTVSLFEPDNIDASRVPNANFGKSGFGPYPIIDPEDKGGVYRSLWDVVFKGGVTYKQLRKMSPFMHPLLKLPKPVLRYLVNIGGLALSSLPGKGQRNIAKTIYACFSIEWIVKNYNPQVIVTQRHPYSVIASWRDLGLPKFDLLTRPELLKRYRDRFEGEPPTAKDSELTQVAWLVGLQTAVLGEAVERHPEWVVVNHEDMCIDPVEKFRALCKIMRIPWSDDVEEFLESSNRPGEGMVTNRVTSEQVDKWRRVLSVEEVQEISSVLNRFPNHGWVVKPEDWEDLIQL